VAGEEKEHTLGDSTSLRWLGVNYRASDGWKAKVTREHPRCGLATERKKDHL
jgi:hypothetical protein